MIPEKPDWARMILELNGKGVSLVEIAESIGVDTNTLYYIKNAGRTRIMWATGAGIYNLHKKRVLDGNSQG